ncbi:MAG: right-handed parallel beta-helix repeat-containing protein, partial [Flavobacteriales bacterium]|nr:right-handed parallel beta-helix repeat-containing protein [Flavobacteriales bacterium]
MKRIFTLLLFIQFSSIIYAETIIVCASCEVKTVRDAVLQASDGDTLVIKKGVYYESEILIDKSLTILGEDLPVIDAESKSKLFTVIADSVTIKGLHIKNIALSYTEDLSAIRIKKQKYFVVEDNVLENIFFGIYIEGCKGGIIRNNIVTAEAVEEFNSGNAIHLWHSKNIKILNNHVEGARDGIYLEFIDSTLVQGNTSTKNIRYGLHFMFSND